MGVCQDFAHVLISLCRHAGLPARYVSGYLGSVATAAASHAWVEAYTPPYGWVGLDATLGERCTGRHVKLGSGRDYADVTVLRGTYQGGGEAALEVEVTCESLGELGLSAQPQVERDEHVGRLVAIQNLGAMRQYQRGAVMVQAMGGMTADAHARRAAAAAFAGPPGGRAPQSAATTAATTAAQGGALDEAAARLPVRARRGHPHRRDRPRRAAFRRGRRDRR